MIPEERTDERRMIIAAAFAQQDLPASRSCGPETELPQNTAEVVQWDLERVAWPC